MKLEQKERTLSLVDALRSGKYKQGRYRLRRDDSFCCLGVACDISGLGSWGGYYSHYSTKSEEGQMAFLPESVRNYFGFENASGFSWINYGDENSLSILNDRGYSFEQIATVIENWVKEQVIED